MKNISVQEAEALVARSQELEAEKEARQAERLEKKRLKEHRLQQRKLERLVAPILLLITIAVSLLIAYWPH